MRTLRIKIPPPHDKQREIESVIGKVKRIVINAGRRAGKTFLAARIAIKFGNRGKRVLYIAPIVKQTDAVWELLCDWLADAIALWLVKKNEQKRTLTFIKSGGMIHCMTGKHPDNLRGGWGDIIILDEFAYQNEEVYKKIVLPMLLDTGGTLIVISTPDKRNHFYHMYLRAVDNKDWRIFRFSSLDNPFLDDQALKDMVEDMTDIDYRQEILAEFVPGVGAVFTVRPSDFYTPGDPQIHKGHRLVAGVDWGQKADYTVLSVGCATCKKELYLERIGELDYPTQRDMLKRVLAPMGVVELLAEENSMGLPNIQQLRLDGIAVQGFSMSNTSKAGCVQAMRLVFANEEWKWVDDETAWRELEAFEQTITPSGLAKYAAPEGLHDDTVIARMLMLHQALTGQLQFY